jgi:hypothetical protein
MYTSAISNAVAALFIPELAISPGVRAWFLKLPSFRNSVMPNLELFDNARVPLGSQHVQAVDTRVEAQTSDADLQVASATNPPSPNMTTQNKASDQGYI